MNYPAIDEGKTRFEENEERKARNSERVRDSNWYGLKWTHHGHMASQQWSANKWAEKAHFRANQGRPLRMPDDASDEADPSDIAFSREEMTDNLVERVNKQARQEMTDSKAEVWESRMSDMARAMREAIEQQRERDREQGMAMER